MGWRGSTSAVMVAPMRKAHAACTPKKVPRRKGTMSAVSTGESISCNTWGGVGGAVGAPRRTRVTRAR